MRTDEAMAVEDLHSTLRGELDALDKSHTDLARRLADVGRKIESDAKVIAARDAKIVELEAGYEIQMHNLDAAEKVIVALRKAVEAAIDRFEGCGMRYGADEIRKLCGDAIEQTAGEKHE